MKNTLKHIGFAITTGTLLFALGTVSDKANASDTINGRQICESIAKMRYSSMGMMKNPAAIYQGGIWLIKDKAKREMMSRAVADAQNICPHQFFSY